MFNGSTAYRIPANTTPRIDSIELLMEKYAFACCNCSGFTMFGSIAPAAGLKMPLTALPVMPRINRIAIWDAGDGKIIMSVVANTIIPPLMKSQTYMSAKERIENVKDAFKLIAPDKIKDRHVLLIDDIVTTGSTLSECGYELAKADNVRISIMALGKTR